MAGGGKRGAFADGTGDLRRALTTSLTPRFRHLFTAARVGERQSRHFEASLDEHMACRTRGPGQKAVVHEKAQVRRSSELKSRKKDFTFLHALKHLLCNLVLNQRVREGHERAHRASLSLLLLRRGLLDVPVGNYILLLVGIGLLKLFQNLICELLFDRLGELALLLVLFALVHAVGLGALLLLLLALLFLVGLVLRHGDARSRQKLARREKRGVWALRRDRRPGLPEIQILSSFEYSGGASAPEISKFWH